LGTGRGHIGVREKRKRGGSSVGTLFCRQWWYQVKNKRRGVKKKEWVPLKKEGTMDCLKTSSYQRGDVRGFIRGKNRNMDRGREREKEEPV